MAARFRPCPAEPSGLLWARVAALRGIHLPPTPCAGDVIATGSRVIEVRVTELRQLFNAIDPSPFRERDLDPRAEDFIVEWARDLPRTAPLALLVHLERAAGRPDEATLLGQAIHQYFKDRAASSRRRLRELFRRGRISLLIALAFLGASLTLSDLIGNVGESGFAAVMREGFIIGGWVAMWRPLEVFLYDWWPIRGEARLFDRLSEMPVRIEYEEHVSGDAWRSDWPAVPTSTATASPRAAALDETIEASFPAGDPPSSDSNPDDHAARDRSHDR